MEHRVLGKNILVKQKEALEQSKGGIVLPDQSKVKPLQGVIVRLGGDVDIVGLGYDEILFDRFAGVPVELDGEQYLVMSQEDILIILAGGGDG